jgi:lipoprotein-anchoring transpeptidase ErfK/SrfK
MTKTRIMMKTWSLSICLTLISSLTIAQLSAAPLKNQPSIDAFKPLLYDLLRRFPDESKTKLIVVSASEQKLYLIENLKVTQSYTISTAKAGLGQDEGSFKTPLGVHRIAEKIGDKVPEGTIFLSRKKTKRIAKILKKPGKKSKGDVITSRILWLSGMERGINKGGKVDSKSRFIYIHGTDEEGRLGKPVSHGCIRMSNKDVIELFDKVTVDTLVDIVE